MQLCQSCQIVSTFLWIAAFVADASAVNPDGIIALLANSLSTFSIKSNQFLVMVLSTYLEILINVLFYATEYKIILY